MNPSEHMIQLQGRDYLPVAARVVWARRDHPAWSIVTEPVSIGDAVYMRATVLDDNDRVLATAHKAVRPGGRGAVGQYPIEAAETGAIGRALGLCGYGTLAGDLGEDEAGDEIADAPAERKAATTNGRSAAGTEKPKPAPAPAFHATPLIDSMTDPGELPGKGGIMAAIMRGHADNIFARNGAWVKALVSGAELANSTADVGIVADAFAKVRKLLDPSQCGEVQSAIDAAMIVLAEAEAAAIDHIAAEQEVEGV